jgi:hypothetical protein
MKTNKTMYCKNEECPKRSAMIPHEYPTHWAFGCPTCGAVQLWDKRRPEIGGTIGAGEYREGRSGVLGRGL